MSSESEDFRRTAKALKLYDAILEALDLFDAPEPIALGDVVAVIRMMNPHAWGHAARMIEADMPSFRTRDAVLAIAMHQAAKQ